MPISKEKIDAKRKFWKENYQMNEKLECLFDINVNLQEEFERFKQTSKSWDLITKIAWTRNINVSLILLPHNFHKLIMSLENTDE